MPETTGQPGRLRLPVCLRVRRRREFERAFARRLRVSDARLTIWAVQNSLEHPRLGLIVGRKHGNAVRRNRIKRVLREAFRLTQHRLPAGLDLVCSPRAGGKLALGEYVESLTSLAARLARRLRNDRAQDDHTLTCPTTDPS